MFGGRRNKDKSDKSNHKDEISDLQQHVHELEEEGAQQKKLMLSIEAELEDRENTLEQTRSSLQTISSLLNEKETQLKERETQEEKLVERIAKLHEEQETAQHKFRIESEEMQSLKDELVQRAAVNTEGDALAVAELQQSLQVEESCAAQLQVRNSDLTSKLHNAEVGVETGREELEERLSALKGEYCQEVDNLRSECASLARAVQDQHTEALRTEQQSLDIDEHARKTAVVEAIGAQENSSASKQVEQPLESARQLLSPDMKTPQADCQSLEARLVEETANYQELQDELAKLREEMYVVEEERDDVMDQLAEERKNLEYSQLESNDASRERDVELKRLHECEKRLSVALQDVTDRDMMLADRDAMLADRDAMLAAKEGDQRLTLMQQALEQQQELYKEEKAELSAARLVTESIRDRLVHEEEAASCAGGLKEQFQSELSVLSSDLDLAQRRMNEVESKEQVSSATFERTAEEHATVVAAIEMQSSEHARKVIALQDELLHAERRLDSGDEVNAQMAASLQEQLQKENLAAEEQNIARRHAELAERLGVEVAEERRRAGLEQTSCIDIASERDIAQSQASTLEARIATMGHELTERSEALQNGRCLNDALAAEQEQRAELQRAHNDLRSQLTHVEDRLATNENSVVMQRLSEELAEARATSIDADLRETRLEEELAKERSRTSQASDESLACSKQVEQVPRLAEAKLHSLGRDTNAPDKQIWEVDRLKHELVEERRTADRLRKENAGLERDMVELVKMLNDLKAAVDLYAVSGAGGT